MSQQKDRAEKNFVSINEFFASIISVAIFNGEMVLKPDKLKGLPSEYQIQVGDKFKEFRRAAGHS